MKDTTIDQCVNPGNVDAYCMNVPLKGEILSAKWSKDYILESDTVEMVVETANFSDGSQILFSIFEDDTVVNDFIETIPVNVYNNKAIVKWQPKYQHDFFGKPEYFFVAFIPGIIESEIASDDLTVKYDYQYNIDNLDLFFESDKISIVIPNAVNKDSQTIKNLKQSIITTYGTYKIKSEPPPGKICSRDLKNINFNTKPIDPKIIVPCETNVWQNTQVVKSEQIKVFNEDDFWFECNQPTDLGGNVIVFTNSPNNLYMKCFDKNLVNDLPLIKTFPSPWNSEKRAAIVNFSNENFDESVMLLNYLVSSGTWQDYSLGRDGISVTGVIPGISDISDAIYLISDCGSFTYRNLNQLNFLSDAFDIRTLSSSFSGCAFSTVALVIPLAVGKKTLKTGINNLQKSTQLSKLSGKAWKEEDSELYKNIIKYSSEGLEDFVKDETQDGVESLLLKLKIRWLLDESFEKLSIAERSQIIKRGFRELNKDKLLKEFFDNLNDPKEQTIVLKALDSAMDIKAKNKWITKISFDLDNTPEKILMQITEFERSMPRTMEKISKSISEVTSSIDNKDNIEKIAVELRIHDGGSSFLPKRNILSFDYSALNDLEKSNYLFRHEIRHVLSKDLFWEINTKHLIKPKKYAYSGDFEKTLNYIYSYPVLDIHDDKLAIKALKENGLAKEAIEHKNFLIERISNSEKRMLEEINPLKGTSAYDDPRIKFTRIAMTKANAKAFGVIDKVTGKSADEIFDQ
ncbi:MAG: hypothetical protein Q7R95_03070, partial [bacterium]|nr:hypothetical protein [bacterium]